jgi:hypothetical protein
MPRSEALQGAINGMTALSPTVLGLRLSDIPQHMPMLRSAGSLPCRSGPSPRPVRFPVTPSRSPLPRAPGPPADVREWGSSPGSVEPPRTSTPRTVYGTLVAAGLHHSTDGVDSNANAHAHAHANFDLDRRRDGHHRRAVLGLDCGGHRRRAGQLGLDLDGHRILEGRRQGLPDRSNDDLNGIADDREEVAQVTLAQHRRYLAF